MLLLIIGFKEIYKNLIIIIWDLYSDSICCILLLLLCSYNIYYLSPRIIRALVLKLIINLGANAVV